MRLIDLWHGGTDGLATYRDGSHFSEKVGILQLENTPLLDVGEQLLVFGVVDEELASLMPLNDQASYAIRDGSLIIDDGLPSREEPADPVRFSLIGLSVEEAHGVVERALARVDAEGIESQETSADRMGELRASLGPPARVAEVHGEPTVALYVSDGETGFCYTIAGEGPGGAAELPHCTYDTEVASLGDSLRSGSVLSIPLQTEAGSFIIALSAASTVTVKTNGGETTSVPTTPVSTSLRGPEFDDLSVAVLQAGDVAEVSSGT